MSDIDGLRAQGLSYSQIGKMLGITKDKAQKLHKRDRVSSPSFKRAMTPPLVVSGDAVVVSDIHVPYTDKKMAGQVYGAAEKVGVGNLIIAGDMFSFDGFTGYKQIVQPDSLERELAAAKSLLEYWSGAYDNIFMLRGNHDQRVLSADKVTMAMLATQITPGCMKASERNYMFVMSGGKRWLIAHQFSYSRNQLKIASALSTKYGCSVIACHQHFAAMGMSENGKHTIVDNPCLCSESTTPYKALDVSLYPVWAQGFTILKGGIVSQYVRGGAWSVDL